jgi:hypothetical protein
LSALSNRCAEEVDAITFVREPPSSSYSATEVALGERPAVQASPRITLVSGASGVAAGENRGLGIELAARMSRAITSRDRKRMYRPEDGDLRASEHASGRNRGESLQPDFYQLQVMRESEHISSDMNPLFCSSDMRGRAESTL